MRYELVIRAYDVMGIISVSGECYGTSDNPEEPTERVWARTATTLPPDSETATEWIQEALETMLRGL